MNIFKETGKTGLRQYGGYIMEEDLHELAGDRKTRLFRAMLYDPVIAAFLFAIEMLVRQVEWTVAPASEDNRDKENADFIDGALLKDMSQPWPETLSEIVSCVAWGWSWFEIVYKRRRGDTRNPALKSLFDDGRVGWRKFAIRSQDSLSEWELDDSGGVQAMVQSAPPTYERCVIPIEKSLLFRTTSNKGNPEGVALLRRVYRAYYFKHRIENLEGIGIERDLAGLPIVELPSEYLDSEASADKKAVYQMAQDLATNIRRDEQAGIVWASDRDQHGNKLYDVRLLSTGGQRQIETDKIISRWDQRILMTMMADFMLLGSRQVGSYALSSDKSELFAVALGALTDSICGVINRHGIPKLLRLNGRGRDASPQLTASKIEKVDIKALGTVIVQLANAGFKFSDIEQQWAKKKVGFPVSEDGAGGETDKKEEKDSDGTTDDPAQDDLDGDPEE